MGLADIERKILEEAETEAKKIEEEGKKEVEKLKNYYGQKIKETEEHIFSAAKTQAEEREKSILVPARLKAKNTLLATKQSLMEEFYREIQKEKNLSDGELTNLRENTEIEVAQMLFR